jgi:Secretion system C-terminal sorting domain
MKSFFVFLFSCFFACAFWQAKTARIQHPIPTEIPSEQEEDEEHEVARTAYIEAMHLTYPGTNWHEIEMQNSLNLNFLRAKMADIRGNDTIAGNIVGEWKEVGSRNQAGRVLCVDYNPATNDVWAAADGGSIWKGKDDGSNWQPMTHDFQLSNIHYLKNYSLPTGNRLIVAANNNKVHSFFYKDDNDPIWHTPTGAAYNAIVANGSVYQCIATPSKIYLFAKDSTEYALYESVDFGATFSRITHVSFSTFGSSALVDIWTDEQGNSSLYLIGKNKCYKLINNQLVLQGTIATGTPTKANLCGAVINGTTYLYAHLLINSVNKFYVSVDGGVTWTAKGQQSTNMFRQNSFGCSAKTPNLLFWGAVNCSKSTNGGTNWADINNWSDYYDAPDTKLHADVPSIHSFPHNGTESIFVTTDGGIFVSQNGGVNFQNITLSGMQNGQYYDTYTHPTQTNYVWAGSQDQGFQRANQNTTGLRDFTQLISGDYGHTGSENGGNSIWSVYPGFAMYYDNYTQTNYSATWDFTMTGNLWLPPLMVEPNKPKEAHIAGGNIGSVGNHLIKLTYSNGNISETEEPFNFGSSVSAMAYSPLNTNYRYVMNKSGIFYSSTDKGINWTVGANGLPVGHYFYGNAILASPSLLNRVIVGGSGYNNPAVYASDDFGQNFYPMSTGLPATLVYGLAATSGEGLIFAATDAGPYVYQATTQQWYYLGGKSAPAETYWSVEYIPALKTVRFGTYGRGIWDFVLNASSLTAITQNEANISLKLYPNPAQDFVRLQGENVIANEIECMIFDATGKEMGSICPSNDLQLYIGNLPKGVYLVEVRNEKRAWRKGLTLIVQ